jgi:hypothetical protein
MIDTHDIPGIIPKSERDEESEKRVQHFLSLTKEYASKRVSNIIHSRVTVENFKNPTDQMLWELDEIKKCKEGYAGMSPKMYFYFNYTFQLNIKEGKIAPDYRVAQDDYFDFISSCQASQEYGGICVKRRRVGASWMSAADVLHDVLFTPYFRVGMNSKTELDSIELFRKVKFIYDNLPDFLRVKTTAGNTKMNMDFSYYVKDEKGNRIRQGNQSEIVVKAPVPTAFEGQMFGKWVCDEAGKIKDLPQMWSYTEDCLKQETTRPGAPFLFGTSGDIGKEGIGLRSMWKHADAHKLRKYFLGGWAGLMTDAYGNDMVEDSIRWIVYERKRMESLGPKLYNDFLQKYPLTIKEAFSIADTGGVGNVIKINSQLQNLIDDPAVEMRGSFKLKSNGEVYFEQDKVHGKVVMYENRIAGLKNGYNAGCDPADHDDVSGEASNLSLLIRRKQHGVKPPQLVLDYTDRPQKVNDFFNQSLLALQYYNNTKVLIERNRFAMIAFFQDQGFKHLLSTSPRGIMTLINGRPVNTIGINTNEAVKQYIEAVVAEEIEEYWEYIPDSELLEECLRWGAENTDRVMAWGMCLMQAKEDLQKSTQAGNRVDTLRMAKYKEINGVIRRF